MAGVIGDVEILYRRPGTTRVTTVPATLNVGQGEWVPTAPAPQNQLSGRFGKTAVPITVAYQDVQLQPIGAPQILPVGTGCKLFRTPDEGDIISFQFDILGQPIANPNPAVQYGGKRRKSKSRRRVNRKLGTLKRRR